MFKRFILIPAIVMEQRPLVTDQNITPAQILLGDIRKYSDSSFWYSEGGRGCDLQGPLEILGATLKNADLN